MDEFPHVPCDLRNYVISNTLHSKSKGRTRSFTDPVEAANRYIEVYFRDEKYSLPKYKVDFLINEFRSDIEAKGYACVTRYSDKYDKFSIRDSVAFYFGYSCPICKNGLRGNREDAWCGDCGKASRMFDKDDISVLLGILRSKTHIKRIRNCKRRIHESQNKFFTKSRMEIKEYGL